MSDKFVKFEIQSIFTPLAIIIAGAIIAGGVYFGLKSGDLKVGNNDNSEVAGTQNANTNTNTNTTTVTTTIGDDPLIGDKSKAKVAIVEFSDFDCPYCKKFYTDTFEQIKTNFIDTGKAVFVYRDLPLPSLHPHAEKKAEAGSCIYSISGTEAFYKYFKAVEEGSITDDAGLTSLASTLGVDSDKFADCFTNSKMSSEVQTDAADAKKAGITGTPGFVIGTLDSNGNVTGTKISGAYPYTTFETTINSYLK